MNRLIAIGAVVVLGAGLALSPAMGEPTGSTGAPAGRTNFSGSKTINVAGKRVVVEVAARRNFSFFGQPQGRLQASVYLATADGSSLPGITNVKISLVQGQQRWSPVLASLPDDVASYQYYVAQNGPLWQVNSSAIAKIEFRVGQNTHRVDVPVKIYATRDLVPVAG